MKPHHLWLFLSLLFAAIGTTYWISKRDSKTMMMDVSEKIKNASQTDMPIEQSPTPLSPPSMIPQGSLGEVGSKAVDENLEPLGKEGKSVNNADKVPPSLEFAKPYRPDHPPPSLTGSFSSKWLQDGTEELEDPPDIRESELEPFAIPPTIYENDYLKNEYLFPPPPPVETQGSDF